MPVPLKNRAGETTWSSVSFTTLEELFCWTGVVEAVGVKVVGFVDVELFRVTGGITVLFPAYLEYIKNPKVPTIRINIAPKIAMAFLFILFLLRNRFFINSKVL